MLDMFCCCLVLYTSILHLCIRIHFLSGFFLQNCLTSSESKLDVASFLFIYLFFSQSDEEGGKEKEGEEGQQKFIAHVPVPSQQEVRH